MAKKDKTPPKPAKLDRKGKQARWTKARAAESAYKTQLRGVARQVRSIVRAWTPKTQAKPFSQKIVEALQGYANLITPWAEAVAESMIADVYRRDQVMWNQVAADMSTRLRHELRKSPPGAIFKELQAQQVTLIKSIPLEASKRVHALAQEGLLKSTRAEALKAEILKTSDIAESRARLIARTETSRAASNLVQARAQHAGSIGYIWRTSEDEDVRPSHKEMNGKYVRWTHPPTLDNLKGHAGTLPNCRCYAEPVFPDD